MSTAIQTMQHKQTMTLKEITDLLGVRHDNAMRVVEKMIEEVSFGASPQIEEMKSNGSGTFNTYQLDKRQSMAVSAKLNTALLMRVIDRWQELENAQPKLPTTYIEALKELVVVAERNQELEAKIEVATAQIEHDKEVIKTKDDLIRVSNEASVKAGEILIREFVKSQDLVDVGEKQFYTWMRSQKIIFNDRNEPYQKFVNAGYFTYKPSEELHGGKFRYTLRVTPRGKVWLAAKYLVYLDTVGFSTVDMRNGLVLIQGTLQ